MSKSYLYMFEPSATGLKEIRFTREVRPSTLEVFDVHSRKHIGKVLGWRVDVTATGLIYRTRFTLGDRTYGIAALLRLGELPCGARMRLGSHLAIARCSFECAHVDVRVSDGQE